MRVIACLRRALGSLGYCSEMRICAEQEGRLFRRLRILFALRQRFYHGGDTGSSASMGNNLNGPRVTVGASTALIQPSS